MDDNAKEVMTKVQQLVKDRFAGDYFAAFKHYDLDASGKLGHKDVVLLFTDCGIGNWITRGAWASGLIYQLDANKDGAISIPELVLAMAKEVV